MLRMLDGDLTAEEAAELDQELIASPEARATWRRLAQIHSCLETRFAAKKVINRLLSPSSVPSNDHYANKNDRNY